MRTNLLPLLALAACQNGGDDGDPDDGALGELQRVDNRSDARLVLVSDEGNWNQDADTRWFVDCGENPDDGVVTVTPEDGELVIRHTDAELASRCDVQVHGRAIRDVLVSGNGDLRIEGEVRNLASLEVRGNGNVDIDRVTTDRLDLIASGNGSIGIDSLHSDEVLIELSGDAEITIGGHSADGMIFSTGNGVLNAGDLELEVLYVELTGSGDATVHVTDHISGFVSGSGSLEILGDPEGDVEESGSGEVHWRG
jgi:hypothetical protein